MVFRRSALVFAVVLLALIASGEGSRNEDEGKLGLGGSVEVRKGSKSSGGGGGVSSSKGSTSSSSSSSTSKTSTGTSSTSSSKASTFSTKVNKSTQNAPRTPSLTSSFVRAPTRFSSTSSTSTAGFRAFYVVAIVMAVSGSSSRRSCGSNEYRYGSRCRICSSETCPVGQYRVECSRHNDGYCKPCTNKPEGYEYTEPGNNNDCANIECPAEGCVDDFAGDTTEVDLTFNMDVPVSGTQFSAVDDRYKGSLTGLAVEDRYKGSVSGLVDGSDVSFSASEVAMNSQDGVSFGASTTRRALPSPAEAQLALAAGNQIRAASNESCGEDPSNTTTAVEVTVTVKTTMEKMTKTWEKLSGYAINEALSNACLPPALVSYNEEASESGSPELAYSCTPALDPQAGIALSTASVPPFAAIATAFFWA
ncbi:hypothetical protein T484DRAFT_1887837 [Baffinella frigidus]|nr:hypothetical protein T484DRAFT_1887837 [Cryptophyta sp. CCMP2293]